MLARSPGIDSRMGIGTITSSVWFILAFKKEVIVNMDIHVVADVNE